MNKKGKSKVFAYLRVSTCHQECQNQRLEIEGYCSRKGLVVDKWFEVEMSSKNGFKERQIDRLLADLKPGDTLICSELSRLARSMRDAFVITDELFRKKVEMHFIKQGLVLSESNMNSTVMISCFSMAAQIERDLISSRTKNGLALAKARGKKLGNPNLVRDIRVRRENAMAFSQSLKGILEGFIAKGMSQRQMVVELNKATIKSPRGGLWYLALVQHTLKRLGLVTRRTTNR